MGYYILVATNQDVLPFQLLTFEPTFLTSELEGKGHEPSRAELKILQLELRLEPARLGLITTGYYLKNVDIKTQDFS